MSPEQSVGREKPIFPAPAGSPYIAQAQRLKLEVPPVVPQPRFAPKILDTPELVEEIGDSPKGILWHLVKKNRKALALSFITALGLRLSGLAMPIIVGKIIDSGIEKGLGPHLIPWSVALLVAIILTGIFWSVDQLGNVALNFRNSTYIGNAVGQKALTNGIATSRKVGTGDVLTAATDDASNIAGLFVFLPAFFAACVTIVIIGWIMIRSSLMLGLIVMIGMPLVIFLITRLAVPLSRKMKTAQNSRAQLNTTANDAILGLRILRGLGGEDRFCDTYREASQATRDKGVKVVPLNATMLTLRISAPAVFQTLIIAIGAWQVYAGNLSAGTLIAFFGMTTYLQAATNTIISATMNYVSAKVSAGRISKILEIPPMFPNPQAGQAAPAGIAGTTLEIPNTQVSVAPGTYTAITGPDLSAADVHAQNLARLHPGTTATLGSVPLASLPLKTVRNLVTYSHGEAEIFAGSLRQNLLGAKAQTPPVMTAQEVMADYTLQMSPQSEQVRLPDWQNHDHDPQLWKALEAAACADITSSLGDDLDGMLLEKGRNLSGGQRQRLALARALATGAPILILVEPTSALDANTENRIGENLAECRKGKTTVLISSSPLLLQHADRVIVLDREGKYLGAGTHHELMAAPAGDTAGDTYRQLMARAGENV
ncbi:hypothetical protein BSR29_00320 [Boudabousia liubingyangii]|uniref:ABC transporter ATP-binding protein n=1 Tax=Boudabousia liubingyangii TaxID=1921764 RepID=A0A1Q5PPK2_9ACTO|nr:ABC transporter ATP-binding protein [Boudabousia liubingyangii]OKL49449.1 hypothetical protein BSR29_00320 [Boudabousia liubingyangii]